MNLEDKIRSFYAKLTPSDKIQSAIAFGTLFTVIIFAIQTNTLNSQTSEIVRQVDLLSNQTAIMQQDSDVNNRPWIGGAGIRIINDYIEYDYKNFGKLPNNSGRIAQLAKTTVISKDELISLPKPDVIASIMPTQEWTSHTKVDSVNLLKGALEGSNDIFVGNALDYQYGDGKTGHYGSIFKYDKELNNFSLIDSWSD